MRRSIRDAIVGLSIVGGIATLTSTMLWLRGFKLSSNSWTVIARFEDASGLAERSPVTYRGILVGSVDKIKVTPSSVKAVLKINNKNLRLSRPVTAKVFTSSLLGGDAQVSLLSRGKPLSLIAPLPISNNCLESNVLCKGQEIKGESLVSISNLTEEIDRMLQQAGNQDKVTSFIESTQQFDLTQKKLEELINQAKLEINRAEPILKNLTEASSHLKNILAPLDNPKTLNDIQETASSTRSIAKRIDNLGSNVGNAMEDQELMDALRKVTIGLGELFNEIYPGRNQ